MQPVLRERSARANASRRMLPETIAEMKDAGFFRILQPARYGGYEMDPQVFFQVQIALAAACPSTAWVLGVVGVHSWQLALFDQQAQEDVWGESTDVLISSSYMPVGKVVPVEGGYRLSGRWGFSSGSDYCDWAFLGAFVPLPEGTKGPPDMRTFLVPKTDYTLEDTWNVSGLRATGSNDVVVDDVFVPEHRTHKFSDGFMMRSPGHAVNDAPLFKLPFGQLFTRCVSTPAIGMARGALREFRALSRERISRADGSKATDNVVGQRVCADAAAAIDEAEFILDRNFTKLMRAARAGEKLSIEQRVSYRYDATRAVDKCVRAVDEMFTNSGSRAIFVDHPMQRFFQDIHACRAHYANNPDKPGRNLGRVLFGQRSTDYFI
ncbi:MAG: acyl-CoA dehydrogenase family protein [Myxococcota bacterium]